MIADPSSCSYPVIVKTIEVINSYCNSYICAQEYFAAWQFQILGYRYLGCLQWIIELIVIVLNKHQLYHPKKVTKH